MKCIVALVAIVYYVRAEEVRLVDLDPNEAQQLINSQDQTLNYAPKIESNVPAVRYLGNEPHHVQEDIYLAKQYHGQDGLGGYLYGYQVPDIAKNEKKEPSGPLRGAYNYINGDGKEIKVEYWDDADGTGFHQIDNVPDVAPKQVEDAPDVAAAKDEFFRRWNEEAERNKHPVVDPNANVDPYSGNQQGIQQSQYQNQPTGGAQYFSNPNPLQNQGYNAQYTGSASSTSQQSVPYQPQAQVQNQQQQTYSPQPHNNGYQPGQQYQGKAPVIQQQVSGASQHQGAAPYVPSQPQAVQQNYHSGQAQHIPQLPAASQHQPQGIQGNYQSKPQTAYNAQSQPSFNPNQGYIQSTSQSTSAQSAGCQQGCQIGTQGTSYQPQSNPLALGAAQVPYLPNQNQLKYQSPQNQIDYSGQNTENMNYYAQPQHDGKSDEEENGPPKGFFYSFDYPVGIIVQKGERALPPGENRSVRDVYEQNKAKFESQLKAGKSTGTQSSYQYVKSK